EDTSAVKINIDRIIVKNTRVIYKDALTGNDMDLTIGDLDTKISTFDPTHMVFEVPSIKLKGLKGHFYQLEPLQQPVEKAVSETASQPETYLQFINKEMNFSDVDVVYKSEPSHLNTSFTVGNLVIHPKKFDLKNGVYALDDVALDNSEIVVQTDSKKDSLAKKTNQVVEDSVKAASATTPFKFLAGEIKINKSNLKYDDASAPHVANGMDFSHLNIANLSLDVNNIEYTTDTTLASVKSASFNEQSGFVLNNFTTDFSMSPTAISVKNLLIQTPNTEIKKSAAITYPSLAAIQKDPSLMGLDIDLENSKISVKDIIKLAPQLSAQLSSLPADAILYVDARVTGKVSDLNLQKVMLRGLTATNIDVHGTLKGLPDPKKISADLQINKFQTSRKDIVSLLPKGSLPSNITLPESIAASGSIKGGMNNLNTDLSINTSLGNAKINGTLVNITDSNNAQYNMLLYAQSIQLGTLMKNPQLGQLTGTFKINGKGLTPARANATFNGAIPNITLNKYNYKNIKADGSIANKVFKINASIHDPNVSADIEAGGEFSGKFPSIHLKATIDSIKAKELNFSTTRLNYHGNIDGDFIDTDPDNLSGKLFVTHSLLVTDSQRINIDSLQLVAASDNGINSLSLSADFLTASIKGKYKLTQLGDVFQKAIDPYFSITGIKDTARVDPYDFSITAGVIDDPTLRAFMPGLTELKPITLNGH
ncbi:MAG: hypothetical protein ABI091_14500, partial [Ferruginibacter sp.]